MAPKNLRQLQDITPAAVGAIRPNTPLMPVSSETDETLGSMARSGGVTKEQVVQDLIARIPQQRPLKRTVTDNSIDKMNTVRELGLVGEDPNDPLNQMMRYGFYKDLKKDMNSDSEQRMSPREMLEHSLMVMTLKMMGGTNGDSNGHSSKMDQMMYEMRAENQRQLEEMRREAEKQREFYESRLKEQDEKIREMMFEKRMRTMEERQADEVNGLAEQVYDLSKRLELYKSIPQNPSPAQAKDAISHIEEIGGQLDRIKNAMSKLGIMSGNMSPAPQPDIYKKADGSLDTFRYAMDKITDTAGRVMEAWQKKVPERRMIEETPQPNALSPGHGAGIDPNQSLTVQFTQQMSPEQYYTFLLQKGALSHEEMNWVSQYEAYLESVRPKQRKQLPPPGMRRGGEEVERAQMPVQQADYRQVQAQEPIRETIPNEQAMAGTLPSDNIPVMAEEPREEKMSMLDKLRKMEEEEVARSQALGI